MIILFSLMPPVFDPEKQRHLVRYINSINSRPERNLNKEKGFCIHHVLPQSMGGTDEHLIKLTYREHYIAHLILWNCGYSEMTTAFFLMNTPWYKGKYYNKNYINSKQYDRAQHERATNLSVMLRGENNPNWNHRWSQESRDALSRHTAKRFMDARWMNNGVESRCVEKDKIKEFSIAGWVFGRLNQKATNNDEVLIHKGSKRRYVSVSEFTDFVKDGWELGQCKRTTVKISAAAKKEGLYDTYPFRMKEGELF